MWKTRDFCGPSHVILNHLMRNFQKLFIERDRKMGRSTANNLENEIKLFPYGKPKCLLKEIDM